jgi:hypothetical protein
MMKKPAKALVNSTGKTSKTTKPAAKEKKTATPKPTSLRRPRGK